MKKIIFRVTCICAVAVMALSSCLRDKVVKPDDSKDYDEAYLEELRKLGDVAFVNLHLAIEGEQDVDKAAETRAPLLDESITSYYNCYVFQFASDSLGSLMMTPPYYVDDTKIAAYKSNPSANPIMVPLLESRGYQTRIVVVGNINDRAYNWGLTRGKHKYRDLLGKYITLTNEGVSYGGTKENLVMAWSDMKVISDPQLPSGTQTDLRVEFHRSVAKIVLNISTIAGYKITKVQMKSVSNRLNICDYLLEEQADTAAFFAVGANNIVPFYVATLNYDPIEWDGTNSLVTAGVPIQPTDEQFVWYVPRNMRGDRPLATAATRNIYAPYGATFFEVDAIDPNGNGVIYTIYPGAGKDAGVTHYDRFEIQPSRKYVTNLDITNPNVSNTDSRIQRFEDIDLDGNSNSYIINPPLVGQRKYKIPIVRVNQYWRRVSDSYGAVNANIINTTTGWGTTVLWQDAPDIIRSTADPIIPYIVLSKPSGNGVWTPSPNTVADAYNGDAANVSGYFEITVPAGAKTGNFVVALRAWDPALSKFGDVLWSWHFWVTDYNPDFVQTKGMKNCVDFKQFVYNVPNGFVERYGGTVWGYSGTIANNWNTYSVATTTPTNAAPYAKSFIMDRYLGAPDNNYNPSDQSNGMVYYQFGRKDPISGNRTLYDIDGNVIDVNPPLNFFAQKWSANANNINGNPAKVNGFYKESVMNPMTFYTSANRATTSGSGDWSGLGEVSPYFLWHDSEIPLTTAVSDYVFKKSMFDPCPPGWAVPVKGTFDDFRGNNPAGVYTTMSAYSANQPTPKNGERGGLHWDNAPVYYMKYYPYVKDAKGGYSLPPRLIMFPVNGARNNATGALNWIGNNGQAANSTLTGYDTHIPVWMSIPSAINTANEMKIGRQTTTATNLTTSQQYIPEVREMAVGGYVRCVSQVQP